jgi:ketosteroid isomerase-like protein
MKNSSRLVLCISIFALNAHLALADEAEAIAAVRCTEISFSLSVENEDRDAFESLIDEDARFVGGSAIRGRANIVDAWSVFFDKDGPDLIWRPQIIEVLESGDLALSRGPYRLRSRDENGDEVVEWGTYNSVWRKNSNGEWHIIFDAGNGSADSLEERLTALIEEYEGTCNLDRR